MHAARVEVGNSKSVTCRVSRILGEYHPQPCVVGNIKPYLVQCNLRETLGYTYWCSSAQNYRLQYIGTAYCYKGDVLVLFSQSNPGGKKKPKVFLRRGGTLLRGLYVGGEGGEGGVRIKNSLIRNLMAQFSSRALANLRKRGAQRCATNDTRS